MTPDPTFTEALDHLAGSLPENPDLDDRHQRALRVVVGERDLLVEAEVRRRQAEDIVDAIEASGLPLYTLVAPPEGEGDAVKVAWVSARRQALTMQEGE